MNALYVPVCSMSNLRRPPEQVRSFLDAMLAMPGRAAIPLEISVAGNLDALPGDYRDRYLGLAKAHRAGFPVHLLLAWSLDDEVLRLTNRFRGSHLILGLHVRDVTAGYKLWHRDTLNDLDLDGIHSNGYSFQVEMNYRALVRGHKILEIPIHFTEREHGTSKMSFTTQLESALMPLRLRLQQRPR